MNRRELRARMKARKAEVRAALAERLKDPRFAKARRRRRIQQAVAATAVVLLLLFIRCDCTQRPKEATVAEVVVPDAGVKVAAPAPKPPPRKPMVGVVRPQPRGKMDADAPALPGWLEQFRLQVSARSPRLAECFGGAERPGAIRWAAAVNPQSGVVSDHEFEPLGKSSELTPSQRDCLVATLTAPKYALKAPETALPQRIGLVIEF